MDWLSNIWWKIKRFILTLSAEINVHNKHWPASCAFYVTLFNRYTFAIPDTTQQVELDDRGYVTDKELNRIINNHRFHSLTINYKHEDANAEDMIAAMREEIDYEEDNRD